MGLKGQCVSDHVLGSLHAAPIVCTRQPHRVRPAAVLRGPTRVRRAHPTLLPPGAFEAPRSRWFEAPVLRDLQRLNSDSS